MLIPIVNSSIVENRVVLGEVRAWITSRLNETNWSIIPLPPLPYPPIIPLPIQAYEQRNVSEGYMTVILPVPTPTVWWFNARIEGYLSTLVTGRVHAYTVTAHGVIARRTPAIALRYLGVSGEIVYASGGASCSIVTPQIAIYTIKCDNIVRIQSITPTDLYYATGAGLWGNAGGYATIGVYMPIGWWSVRVAAFNKGAIGRMDFDGHTSIIWIG